MQCEVLERKEVERFVRFGKDCRLSMIELIVVHYTILRRRVGT